MKEGKQMINISSAKIIDNLGRLCIPIEARRTLNITDNDKIDIFIDNDRIIIKKHHNSCIFCNSHSISINFKNRYICQNCFKDIKKIGNFHA